MKTIRLQLRIPEELALTLFEEATRRGLSVPDYVIQLLKKHTAGANKP